MCGSCSHRPTARRTSSPASVGSVEHRAVRARRVRVTRQPGRGSAGRRRRGCSSRCRWALSGRPVRRPGRRGRAGPRASAPPPGSAPAGRGPGCPADRRARVSGTAGSVTGSGRASRSVTRPADAARPGRRRAPDASGAITSWTAIGVSATTARATPARLPARTAPIPASSAIQTCGPGRKPGDQGAGPGPQRGPPLGPGEVAIGGGNGRQCPRRRPERRASSVAPAERLERGLREDAARGGERPLRPACDRTCGQRAADSRDQRRRPPARGRLRAAGSRRAGPPPSPRSRPRRPGATP